MELFAAATGCDDMGIASLYLERAGNDVTRAVNHYLDSPPPAEGSAKTAATLHAVMSSTKAKPKQHHMRGGTGVKRPRDAGGSGQQGLLTFQPPIPRTLSLQGNVGSCSLSRDGEDSGESELRDDVDVSKLKFCGSSTSGPTLRAATPSTMDNKGRSGTSPFSPSAKWVEIAELCQRRGVQFDDERFPPRPTSLDGRPGRVSTPPSKNPNLGEEEDKQALRCRCDMPAKVVTVSKAGPNQGKLFYGCVTRKCNFFRWADDAPHTRQALSLVWRRFTPPRFKLTTTLLGRSEGSAFKPQDIKQGAVGDCWFLAGLAVVSERSDLIARVVGCTPSLCDEVGCFEVNLFKDGCWERVLVDSWLPCKDPAMLKGKEKGLDHLPAFAKTSNNQTWPCIVEKAFAKQHGSFEAISGGHVCEAFEALTGAPTETVELDDNDSEGNWAKLLSFSQAEFPMGCATAWDPTRYDCVSVAPVRAAIPRSCCVERRG
ncbi:unnamed protein product [Sphacelaria rigidula]